MQLQVVHAGRSHTIDIQDDCTLSQLQSLLEQMTLVSPRHQKILAKGKQVQSADPGTRLDALLQGQTKLMLVGTPSEAVQALKDDERDRAKKREAFDFHAAHKHAPVRTTTVRTINDQDDSSSFKVHQVVPFPPEIPCIEARRKMLDRLATDPAVLHVMKLHKFVVGTLTELHPHANPDLLGLNKNAGQSIHLRILTDRLDGTRAYLDIRKVLLHELAHNVFGPHDNNFKELNSLLTKQVVAYEQERGISTYPSTDAWEPENQDEEKRTARRLNEAYEPSAASLLKFDEADYVEERRQLARKAAEQRQARQP